MLLKIAELTDLPKKLIKGITKGEYFPSEEESARLYDVINNAIVRLRDNVETDKIPTCPEQSYDSGRGSRLPSSQSPVETAFRE